MPLVSKIGQYIFTYDLQKCEVSAMQSPEKFIKKMKTKSKDIGEKSSKTESTK